MNYAAAYDIILELQAELTEKLAADTQPDPRTVQALAAAYTLQDYTADRLAELGLSEEG